MSTVLNEEKIIHQKLLYKEYQLKRFIGKYTDFLFNFDKYSQAECENIAKDISSELELLEFQIHKAEMANHSRKKDHKYHLNLYQKLESSVSTVHKDIESLYDELKLRTEQLKNKFEYEALSTNINELERIENMDKKIQFIQRDIDDLNSRHIEQREKIELKEKQLYQLIHALNEIQDILTVEKQNAMEEEPEKPITEQNA